MPPGYVGPGSYEAHKNVPEVQRFSMLASDEQVVALIRLAEQDAWDGYSGLGFSFLRVVPEIFASRLDVVEPELYRAMMSLAESKRRDVSGRAKDMLRHLRPPQTEDPADGK